jgi:putative spermidine/putrescine transport system permease protein
VGGSPTSKKVNFGLVLTWKARIIRNQSISLLPVLAFLFLLFVFPISIALYKSFWDPDFSFKHYYHFFTQPLYLNVILSSFRISLIVAFVCLILGYPYAYLAAAVSERRAGKLLFFAILSFWISLLVRNYAWIVLLGRRGIINTALLQLGILSQPAKLVFNTIGLTIGMVHVMLPFMILSLYSVMSGIDRNLLKAAQSLGANRIQSFVKVFFPLSLPGVYGGFLMVFITSIGFFITPALLGGAKDTMIAQLIAENVTTLLNWGLAFAASFVLLFFTVLILFVYNKLFGLDRMWGGVVD